MTPEEFERERLKSAEALNRVVEGAPAAQGERTPESVLGAPPSVSSPVGESTGREPEASWNPPAPPDLAPVNESFRTSGKGKAGSLLSLVGGQEEFRQAQERFNADQVRLDNAIVTWTAEHFAATHRHYDAVIGRMQTRMDEIDARHRELERELVRHVHEMARRIDLVLGEGEKGRVSHEAALRSVRERLRALEEKLR